jgi:hypothetical protein
MRALSRTEISGIGTVTALERLQPCMVHVIPNTRDGGRV